MKSVIESIEFKGQRSIMISTGATIVEDIFDDAGNVVARQVYTTKEPMVVYLEAGSVPVNEVIYYKIPKKD